MQCGNNIKQLGLAALNYESAHKRLPAGRTENTSFSAFPAMLPFMEQNAAYNMIDFAVSPNHANILVARVHSDPDSFVSIRSRSDDSSGWLAGTNYRTNQGATILKQLPSHAGGTNFGMPEPNGADDPGRYRSLASITDGMSNTAMISEHGLGDFSNAISTFTVRSVPGLIQTRSTKLFNNAMRSIPQIFPPR